MSQLKKMRVMFILATFIPGGLAASISGSIGGVVYNKNNTARNKTIPVQPDTESQLQARANFGANSTAWLALTTAVQTAWGSLAASVTRFNRQGVSYAPSGRQLFMELNGNLTSIGENAITAAPALGAMPPWADILSATVAPDSVRLALTAELPNTVTARIYATGVRRPGVKFNKGFRLVGIQEGGADSDDITVTAGYLAAFGAPITGMRVQFRIDVVQLTNGHASPAKKILATVG